MKYFKKFWGSVWNSGTTEQCQDPDNDLCWERSLLGRFREACKQCCWLNVSRCSHKLFTMGIVAFTREIQYFVYRLGQYEFFNKNIWPSCSLGLGRRMYVLFIFFKIRQRQGLLSNKTGRYSAECAVGTIWLFLALKSKKYLNSVVGCSTVLNFVNHIFNLVRPYCRHIYFGQTARCSPAFSNTPKIVRYFCCWIVRISSIDFSNIICSNLLGKPGWESYGASRFSRRHYCSLQVQTKLKLLLLLLIWNHGLKHYQDYLSTPHFQRRPA